MKPNPPGGTYFIFMDHANNKAVPTCRTRSVVQTMGGMSTVTLRPSSHGHQSYGLYGPVRNRYCGVGVILRSLEVDRRWGQPATPAWNGCRLSSGCLWWQLQVLHDQRRSMLTHKLKGCGDPLLLITEVCEMRVDGVNRPTNSHDHQLPWGNPRRCPRACLVQLSCCMQLSKAETLPKKPGCGARVIMWELLDTERSSGFLCRRSRGRGSPTFLGFFKILLGVLRHTNYWCVCDVAFYCVAPLSIRGDAADQHRQQTTSNANDGDDGATMLAWPLPLLTRDLGSCCRSPARNAVNKTANPSIVDDITMQMVAIAVAANANIRRAVPSPGAPTLSR